MPLGNEFWQGKSLTTSQLAVYKLNNDSFTKKLPHLDKHFEIKQKYTNEEWWNILNT